VKCCDLGFAERAGQRQPATNASCVGDTMRGRACVRRPVIATEGDRQLESLGKRTQVPAKSPSRSAGTVEALELGVTATLERSRKAAIGM